MSISDDLAVLSNRVRQSRDLARRATDRSARIAHEAMATDYEGRIATLSENPLGVLFGLLDRHVPLSADDKQALLALPFTLCTFAASAYLVREGDAPTQCALLLSGFAYRQKLTRDGARQILSLHLPGEALDLQNLYLDRSDHNVQTLTRAQVAIIPRAALAEVARMRPAIDRAIIIALLIEASISREWLLNVGRRTARAQVAHLLCEFSTRLTMHGGAVGDVHELPMSQEQVGDALGLTPVHVNRTLRSLEEDGLLTRTGRSISFPAWDRLRVVADFSPQYLHLKQQRA